MFTTASLSLHKKRVSCVWNKPHPNPTPPREPIDRGATTVRVGFVV